MNAKAEQKANTHTSIVASACKLLRERGIAGARVADVMKGAGLTVGGFYAHFDSKEALMDDAIRRTAAHMLQRLFERIEEKPKEARAEVVLKRYLSALHRDDASTGCPFPAIVGEVATGEHAHRDVLAESIGKLSERIAQELPKEEHLSKKSIALGMIALMYGGISLARALGPTEMSDEILKACRAFGKVAINGGVSKTD